MVGTLPETARGRPAKDGLHDTSPAATIPDAAGAARNRPPLAPASVYAPLARRRWWWYAYRCRTCGAHQFGRAKTLDRVAGVRRAGCGHQVSVMAARIYTSSEAP